MKRILSLLLACSTCQAKSIVTEDFIHKIAIIESNINPYAVGDNGNSLGAFQIQRGTWADAIAYSRVHGELHGEWIPEEWKTGAMDYDTSFRVAGIVLRMYEQRMIKDKIKPTPIKLYMAYNLGWHGASYYKFDMNHTWGRRRAILVRANNILSR